MGRNRPSSSSIDESAVAKFVASDFCASADKYPIHLNNPLAVVALFVALPGPQLAHAQALADPMRPPAIAATPVQGAPADAGAARTRLQSVLISSGRRSAVIDGVVVPLGGSVGESRLVRITESEVVLKKGEETEVLKLYPSVDKKAVKPRRSASSRKEDKR